MKKYDKPEYINVKREDKDDKGKKDKTIALIKDMVDKQLFAVLATKSDGECYTSLISYASYNDYKTLVFATPIKTKKFEAIEKYKNVSVLIDNRSNDENSINDLAAITSLGDVKILQEDVEIDKWSKILIEKHQYLDDFINADSTAIVLIEVSKYLYVSSFQEVVEWIP